MTVAHLEQTQCLNSESYSWESLSGPNSTSSANTSASVHEQCCSTSAQRGHSLASISANRLTRQCLFTNAIEHGGSTITVRVEPMEGGFAIEDDGPGIPADECDRIFEDGYSTSDRGTGLGLTIVAEIVDEHGWNVHVTEGDDGGAQFEFTDMTDD